MTITDLNNDYYLVLNDIWVKVNMFAQQTARLDLSVRNISTGKSFNFRLYPSPENEYCFNISVPVRSLFEWFHISNCQTLHRFEIIFSPTYADGSSESVTLTKYFVWGGREKRASYEWHLEPSAPLIVGKWIQWGDILLPGFAKRIQGSEIVDFVPTETYKMPIRGCDYKIVRFLNSLGGWQYYIFETYEYKVKTKPGKTAPITTTALTQDNFRNLGTDYEQILELRSRTPHEVQEVFIDLVLSTDVCIYNLEGTDLESRWQRLRLENNDSIENNFDKAYENKIEFSLSNNINRGY